MTDFISENARGPVMTTENYNPPPVTVGFYATDQAEAAPPANRPGYPTMAAAGRRLGMTNAVATHNPDYARCTDGQHFFECKHEAICECGRTGRLPVDLPEGI